MRYTGSVGVAAAFENLPEVYRDALRLAVGGADADAVAAALDIPAEAVIPLLRLAAAKYETLLGREPDE